MKENGRHSQFLYKSLFCPIYKYSNILFLSFQSNIRIVLFFSSKERNIILDVLLNYLFFGSKLLTYHLVGILNLCLLTRYILFLFWEGKERIYQIIKVFTIVELCSMYKINLSYERSHWLN